MLREFYEAVLPSQGYYVLFEGPRKRHVWFDSISDLTGSTEHKADQPDLYFATASFREPTSRTIENALYRRAFCFDIDAGPEKVAKHGDKVYGTQAEALAALMAWAGQTGVRPSWILSSGAGLHVYFLLDQDTEVEAWSPVARALKAMAVAGGLKIDPGPAANAALVLRPPGSLHRGGARIAVLAHTDRTYSLERMAAKTAGHAPPPPRREKSANSLFLDAPQGPPKSLAKVVQHCAAMRHAVSVRGDVSEPYWRAMLGVIKFTAEGAAAAHAASEGHPEYDYDATQQKFDRWSAGPSTCSLFEGENPQACSGCKYRGKVKSPILLGELNDEEVAAQPEPPPPPPAPPAPPTEDSWSTADDEPPVEKDPWNGHIPDGFSVKHVPGGQIVVAHRMGSKPDPTDATKMVSFPVEMQFSGVAFWFESWAAGSNDTDPALATFCVMNSSRRSVSRFTMPTRNAAQRDVMLGTLAAQNVQVYPSTTAAKQLMEDYVKASLERIRSSSQRQKIAERFGSMYDDKGNLVVAQGRHLINANGAIFEGVTQDRLRVRGDAYCVPLPESTAGAWGPEVWQSHIFPRARRHIEYLREFYSDPNFRPYQLAIMLAWASPMLAFTQGGYHANTPLPGFGLTVSLYSPRSGIGKTAAMHAAALAFGVPSSVVMQLDRKTATDNARQALLAQSGTLPCFMDEMEDVEAKDLASLISSVGNGEPKKRLTRDLAVIGGTKTALINVMSTNKSHRELAAADRNESPATQMRLLEIECSEVQTVSPTRRAQEAKARSDLYDCAGAVGAVLHLAMCTMGSKTLNDLGLKFAEKASRAVDGRQDGRFMWRALGAMLATRHVLRTLGLDVFDDFSLIEEFRRWHNLGYEFAAEQLLPSNGVDQLALMLGDLASKTLITHEMTDRRGKHKDNTKFDIPLNDHVPGDVVARGVTSRGYIMLKTDAIRDWAFRRKVSHQGIIRAAREAGIFETNDKGEYIFRGDLFQGTRLAQGLRVPVVKVQLDRLDPEMQSHIETRLSANVRELRPRTTPEQTAEDPRTAGPVSG